VAINLLVWVSLASAQAAQAIEMQKPRGRPEMNSDKNTAQSTDVSPRTAAIVAGLGLLLMAVLAPFANFYVLQNLVVANDAKTTALNIVASNGLFRIGVCCFLVVAVLDVVVAWALYVLLEPVNKSLSLLAAWFRVVYAAVFVIALMPLLGVLQLLSGAEFLKGLETNQLNAQVMLSVGAFRSGWDLGLVIFGFYLLVLGYLIFKSGFIPKWLGILVGIASVGYLVDSFGKFLIPNYNLTVSTFTFVGEFLLIFWLLWKGIKGFDEKPTMQPRRA
jgi:hypothetical protein